MLLFSKHRQFQSKPFRGSNGLLIASIGMAHHTGTAVVDQHPSKPPVSLITTIAHDHHSRMLRISHPHTATMMQTHPGSAARSIEQCIQQRPIGNSIGSILHAFGFTIGAGDRASIQMISADNNRRAKLPSTHHLVESQACQMTLAQPQPTDTRRQSLESNALTRHIQPTMDMLVFRKQRFNLGVRFVDIFRIAR